MIRRSWRFADFYDLAEILTWLSYGEPFEFGIGFCYRGRRFEPK